MVASQSWRFTRLSVLSLLFASSFVSAQGSAAAGTTTSYSSGSTTASASSTSSSPITHTIEVALGGFTFTPDVTLAEVGDFIQYNFYPTNHSVVRAEWLHPCVPYEDTGVDKIGFFSGFKPVDAILQDPPTFTIQVNDTNPIFYYCSAPGSCINYGMVGVINPNATTPIETQIQYAKNSTFMLEPGQPWPAESTPDPFSTGSSTSAPTSTSTSSSTSSTAAATSSAAAAASGHHSSLSGGAIAGIVIGGAAVAVLAGALLYMCGRQSRQTHQPIPQAPYNPHMSYMPTTAPGSKHTTIVSGHEAGPYGGSPYTSPALPGYVPAQDPAMPSPVRPYYAPSDALSPSSEHADGRSPSPTQMMRGVGVPPYSSMAQQAQQPMPDSRTGYGGVVHEMDSQNGYSNGHRTSSITKSAGVERYG